MAEGIRFGPWSAVAPIGSGGMGVVYEAHDSAGRRAAVKSVVVPRPSLLAGIRREIRALQRLEHPGVVRILDSGLQDGIPWYAMAWLDGPTLADAIADAWRGGAPSPAARERLLGAVASLCSVLAWVHGEGLVHRDLKPENVFVRADGTVTLVDFGLAGSASSAASRDRLVAPAPRGGSTAWMAPEQQRGEATDARADLFAVGQLVVACWTGRLPPDPAHPPDLPAALDPVVRALRRPDPDDRPATAAAVLGTLRALGHAPPRWMVPAPAPRPRLVRAPWSGQDDARGALTRALEHLVRYDDGSALVVHGPPGIGRSRLLQEVARDASARGATVCIGGAPPPTSAEHGAPLWPLHPALEALADRCISGGPRETDLLLGRAAPLLANALPILADVPLPADAAVPEPLSAEAAHHRIVDALADTLGAWGRAEAVVLLLDDLQWADEATVEALQLLVRRRRQGLLVVVALRDSVPGADELRDRLVEDGASAVPLRPLPDEDLRVVLDGMLGGAAPPPLADGVVEHAAGNPWAACELLEAALHTGSLARDVDRWTFRPPLPVPAEVHKHAARRLLVAVGQAPRAAAWAALLGAELDPGVLPDDVQVELDLLIEAGALHEVPGGRVRFRRPRDRERVLAGLAPARREQVHRSIAARLDRRAPTFATRAAAGDHWEAGSRPERAVSRWLEAAEIAGELAAWPQASRVYGRALEHPELPRVLPDPIARAGLHRDAAWAAWGSGDARGAQAYLRRCLDLLGFGLPGRSGWRRRLVGAALRQLPTWLPGDTPPGVHDRDAHGIAAEAFRVGSWAAILQNEGVPALVQALEASNHAARAGRPRGRATDDGLLGMILELAGVSGLSARYLARAERIQARSGSLEDRVLLLVYRATLALSRARLAEGRALCAEGHRIAVDIGDRVQAPVLAATDMFCANLLGCLDEVARRGEQVWRESDNAMARLWVSTVLSEVAREQGRLDDALRYADTLVEALADNPDDTAALSGLALRARALAALGRLDEAVQDVRDAESRFDGDARSFGNFTLARHAPEIWLEALARSPGDRFLRARCDAACGFSETYADSHPVGRSPALAARGRLQALTGDVRRARRTLAEAAALAREQRIPAFARRADHLLGELT